MLQLPAGSFTLTEPVKPRSGTRVEGAGMGRTVLRWAGTAPGALIELSDRQNVSIRDLSLDGGGQSSAFAGIYAHRASHLTLDHLSVRNFGKDALGIHLEGDNPTHANGVTDSIVSNCEIENIGVGSEWSGGLRFSWGSSRN